MDGLMEEAGLPASATPILTPLTRAHIQDLSLLISTFDLFTDSIAVVYAAWHAWYIQGATHYSTSNWDGINLIFMIPLLMTYRFDLLDAWRYYWWPGKVILA